MGNKNSGRKNAINIFNVKTLGKHTIDAYLNHITHDIDIDEEKIYV